MKYIHTNFIIPFKQELWSATLDSRVVQDNFKANDDVFEVRSRDFNKI